MYSVVEFLLLLPLACVSHALAPYELMPLNFTSPVRTPLQGSSISLALYSDSACLNGSAVCKFDFDGHSCTTASSLPPGSNWTLSTLSSFRYYNISRTLNAGESLVLAAPAPAVGVVYDKNWDGNAIVAEFAHSCNSMVAAVNPGDPGDVANQCAPVPSEILNGFWRQVQCMTILLDDSLVYPHPPVTLRECADASAPQDHCANTAPFYNIEG